MRLGIVSDIHGNIEALTAVLADLDAIGPDAVYCLGDTVGYGPDPEACVRLVRERNIASVMGNHEYALESEHRKRWFNPMPRKALDITESLLSPESMAWCKALPRDLVVDTPQGRCRLVHGFPPRNLHLYLYQVRQRNLRRGFDNCDEPVIFVGHTHDLARVTFDGQEARRRSLGGGVTRLDPSLRHMLNVGSVGQPRDDIDKSAKYAIWDSAEHAVQMRFVPYDAEPTARKIIAAGIPRTYAERLV